METAPEKIKALCLEGKERDKVVEGNVKVVSKLVIPVTVSVVSPFMVTMYVKSALFALPVVPSVMTTVMLVGVMLVTEDSSAKLTVVSLATTSTTEGGASATYQSFPLVYDGVMKYHPLRKSNTVKLLCISIM